MQVSICPGEVEGTDAVMSDVKDETCSGLKLVEAGRPSA